MGTASAPLPREAEAVLSWWLPRIRRLLGATLRGVQLGGGVVLGDFAPGWSDLDVCVQLNGSVDEELAVAVGALHAEAEQRFLVQGREGWRSTQLLEGPYLPHDLVGEVGATGRFLRMGTGSCRVVGGDPVPGFERHVLAHHAHVLAGEPAVFAPPPHADLARSQGWLLERLAQPAAEHSAIMLAGLLQEAARSLVFWRDGVFLGKTAALEREVARGGTRGDTFRVALAARRTGSAEAAGRRAELAAAYEQVARPARAELLALLADARRGR